MISCAGSSLLRCFHHFLAYLHHSDLFGVVLEEHRLQDDVPRALPRPFDAPVFAVLGVRTPRDVRLLLATLVVHAEVTSDGGFTVPDDKNVSIGSVSPDKPISISQHSINRRRGGGRSCVRQGRGFTGGGLSAAPLSSVICAAPRKMMPPEAKGGRETIGGQAPLPCTKRVPAHTNGSTEHQNKATPYFSRLNPVNVDRSIGLTKHEHAPPEEKEVWTRRKKSTLPGVHIGDEYMMNIHTFIDRSRS